MYRMRSYIKKLGEYSLGPILGAIISFITIPLITYFISPDEFGRVSMFTLATSLVELVIYLGLDQAYVKFYYELDKRDVFFNSMLTSFAFSILIGTIVLIAHRHISFWLFDNKNEFGLVVMLVLYLPFSVLGRFHSMFARISEHAIRYSVFSILTKLIMLISCIGFFYITGKQYRSVIYATTFAQVLTPIIMIIINSREIHFKGVRISKSVISRLLAYGLPLIPATVVGWVLNSIDKVMIRSLIGYDQLGLYSAALKIVSVLAIIQSCFVAFWTPVAFRWNREGVSVKRFDLVGQILCFVMSFLFTLILLFKDIIIAILSPGYHAAVTIIPFLLLHPIMYTISEVTVVGIYFTGRSTKTIIVAMVSCIINVVGNALLIPKYGAIGASIATGVSYCVFFWIRTFISRNIWQKIRIDYYIIYSILLIILSSLNVAIQGKTIYIVNVIACVLIICMNLQLIKTFFKREKN